MRFDRKPLNIQAAHVIGARDAGASLRDCSVFETPGIPRPRSPLTLFAVLG